MNLRRGMTLIELMVAMALLVVFITIAFSTFSSMAWQRAASRQMLDIRGTLRTASESISEEVRLAAWPGNPGSDNPYLVSPKDGQLSDSLTIVVPEIVVPDTLATLHEVRFYIDGTAAGGQRLMREDCPLVTGKNTPLNLVEMDNNPKTQYDPLTPYFTQIVHAYFALSGGRITTVMVARLQLQGQSRDVSVIGLTYVRNFSVAP